jgi:hypothetical protein
MIVETVCRMGHVLLLGCRSQNPHPEQLQALSFNKGIRANVINVGILGGWTAGDCTRSNPERTNLFWQQNLPKAACRIGC